MVTALGRPVVHQQLVGKTVSGKHGNSTLFWRIDKNSIACKSPTSLVICTVCICRDKMVCERLAGSKRIYKEILTERNCFIVFDLCIQHPAFKRTDILISRNKVFQLLPKLLNRFIMIYIRIAVLYGIADSRRWRCFERVKCQIRIGAHSSRYYRHRRNSPQISMDIMLQHRPGVYSQHRVYSGTEVAVMPALII